MSQEFKADAGKLQARLLFEGMPRALLALTAVLSYGAQKYEAHSWKNVSMDRYRDAKFRHLLEEYLSMTYAREDGVTFEGVHDEESGLPHSFHEAINTMFLLEDSLAELSQEEFKEMLKFNKPPQDHKVKNETI